MLSVPVPSLMVKSPLHMQLFIMSSIINDVSPFGFEDFLVLLLFELFPVDYLLMLSPSFFVNLVGEPVFGPFALFLFTYVTACSFV